mmetsp:Transcript_907/g.1647  ORF Transcript_907/g.1647 Transcript_907/m.1647 type:complete len:223 (+) Transcript_907:454-1122(+)
MENVNCVFHRKSDRENKTHVRESSEIDACQNTYSNHTDERQKGHQGDESSSDQTSNYDLPRSMVSFVHELACQEDECNDETNTDRSGTDLQKQVFYPQVLFPVVKRNSSEPAMQPRVVVTDTSRAADHFEGVVMALQINGEHCWAPRKHERGLNFCIWKELAGAGGVLGGCVGHCHQVTTSSSEITPAAQAERKLILAPSVEDRAPACTYVGRINWVDAKSN